MPISTEMMVRVAHADIAMRMAFPLSIMHWHRGRREERPWKVLPEECDAILIGKDDGVVIDGNCSKGASAPDGGVLHIYGDLASQVDVAGHHEIVVTGDVHSDAVILASGFCHVFVGGALHGELRSTGSAKLWVEGGFEGVVKTGTPSTEVYVGNDYLGTVLPNESAALLWLTVNGFASQASLSRIVDCGYTQFNASIAQSDIAPGIYPANGHSRKQSGGNSFNRWCVQSQREGESRP